MLQDFEEPSLVLPPSTGQGRLYLGNRRTAESITRLNELDITHVVNAAPIHVQPTEEMRALITYHECDLKDSMKYTEKGGVFDDVLSVLDPAVEFISSHIRTGRNVLVHCAGGISRSATICLAFLMRFEGPIESEIKTPMNLAQGMRRLQLVRPIIAPNAGFMRQLLTLEQEKFGETSVEDPISDHQRGYKIKPGF